MLQLNSPQKIKDSILSVRSQPEIFYALKSSICKRRWFCVSLPNHHSMKILKIATTFGMCRYSNLIFSATTGLIHQWKSQLKDLFFNKRSPNISSCYWELHHIFRRPRCPEGWYWKWFIWIIETVAFSGNTVLISFMRVRSSKPASRKKFDPVSSQLVFCFFPLKDDLICHRVLPEHPRRHLMGGKVH